MQHQQCGRGRALTCHALPSRHVWLAHAQVLARVSAVPDAPEAKKYIQVRCGAVLQAVPSGGALAMAGYNEAGNSLLLLLPSRSMQPALPVRLW